MIENEMPEGATVIGFAFDGTGYGLDNMIWGSEVMVASYSECRRVAHLSPFRLPGGDRCVKEPCRTAFSLLYETYGKDAANGDIGPFSKKEKSFILEMITKKINSPLSSGMGRLFDGVSSLINLHHRVSYHAQAAIAIEQLALKSSSTDSYQFRWHNDVIYFQPVIEGIMKDIRSETPREIIAKKFHNSITELIIEIAVSLRKETDITHVALTGGVFQNVILLESVFQKLQEKKFSPLIHQRVPANDGGISLGQAAYSIFL